MWYQKLKQLVVAPSERMYILFLLFLSMVVGRCHGYSFIMDYKVYIKEKKRKEKKMDGWMV